MSFKVLAMIVIPIWNVCQQKEWKSIVENFTHHLTSHFCHSQLFFCHSEQTFGHDSILLTGLKINCKGRHFLCLWSWLLIDLQGLFVPFACVGSGDPVRVLHLYTTNTLDTLWSIYCSDICTTCHYRIYMLLAQALRLWDFLLLIHTLLKYLVECALTLYCVVTYICACVDASRTVFWDRSDFNVNRDCTRKFVLLPIKKFCHPTHKFFYHPIPRVSFTTPPQTYFAIPH